MNNPLPAIVARASARFRYHRMALRQGCRYRDFYLLPGDAEGVPKPSRSGVALTFDDGPFPAIDEDLLSALAAAEAKATFFLVGSRAQRHPEMVRRILSAGHEVAVHGWSHRRMTELDSDEQRAELRRSAETLRRLGADVRWFRPPWGDFDERTLRIAEEEGQRLLLWTLDSRDFRYDDPARVARRVVSKMTDGSVVCMHSNRSVTPKSLPRILEDGGARGLRFVSATEWAANRSAPIAA